LFFINQTLPIWDKSLLYDFFGEPTYYYSRMFNGKNRVILMAGAHPIEEAGVYALHTLLSRIDFLCFENIEELIIIPCRNPLGFNASSTYERNCHQVVTDNIHFTLLQDTISDTLYPTFFVHVKMNGKLSFGCTEWWSALKAEISLYNFELIHLLIFPPLLNGAIRGNSYLYHNHRFYDFNSGFGLFDWSHLKGLADFIKKINPNILIDLHEGLGNGFYIYVNPDSDTDLQMGNTIIPEMQKIGWTINNNVRFRQRLSNGLYSQTSLQKNGTISNALNPGNTFMTFETGINLHLNERIKCNLDAIKIVIEQCIK